MRQLNKQKALELLPLVVDGEAGENDRRAFFQYIEQDREVHRKYESMKRIKKLIRERTPRVQTPEDLKAKISTLIEQENKKSPYRHPAHTGTEGGKPKTPEINSINDPPSPRTWKRLSYPRWTIFIAAVLLLSFITFLVLDKTGPVFENEFNLEDYVFSHFVQQDHLSMNSIQPASLAEARETLSSRFSHSLRIPQVKEAHISGVFNIDFVPEYKTPMLEYGREETDESIYIFAFNLDSLEVFKKLIRDPEAVRMCQNSTDFHVREIQGKHIVSWKWGNYWYTAISHQNGHDLASRVEQLDSDGEK